jgi:hypothetical protein
MGPDLDKPEPKGVSRQDAKVAKEIFRSWFLTLSICFSLRAWRLCEKISYRLDKNLIHTGYFIILSAHPLPTVIAPWGQNS